MQIELTGDEGLKTLLQPRRPRMESRAAEAQSGRPAHQ
jgi:hypothetical protein